MDYLSLFFFSLFFTILAETLALFLLARRWFCWPQRRMPGRLLLFAGILASACTLPYVWFVFPALFASRLPYIIAAESFAVLAEALIYLMVLRIPLKEAFLLSLACNALSFGLGLLLL